MKTDLKQHNLEAYDKIQAAFNCGKQKVSIEHATGTGKTYEAVAVSENYRNCLYISPSRYINNQFINVVLEQGLDPNKYYCTTYQYLLGKNIDFLKNKFDLLIIDEFHRLGAEKWREKYEELLSINPSANVFAMTATETRFLDGGRNMAEELGYNKVSSISLINAIKRGILPVPCYHIGCINYEKELSKVERKLLDESKVIPNRENLLNKLKTIKTDWINSNGIAGIIQRGLQGKEVKKIIVFSDSTERFDEISSKLKNWFAFTKKTITVYRADSTNKSEARKSLELFSEDSTDDTIKFIISVNMLNEGVHVPNVDACMMFRRTDSKTIYFQQFGRVLTSNKNSKPIVFDLVDNISQNNILEQYDVPVTSIEPINSFTLKKTYGDIGVSVEDSTLELSEIEEKIEDIFKLVPMSLSEVLEKLPNFQEVTGRNPSAYSLDEKERKLYNSSWGKIKRGNKQVIEIWSKLSSIRFGGELNLGKIIIDNIETFYKSHSIYDNFPRQLAQQISNYLRNHNHADDEYRERILDLVYLPIKTRIDELITQLLHFQELHDGYNPTISTTDPEELSLCSKIDNIIKRHKSDRGNYRSIRDSDRRRLKDVWDMGKSRQDLFKLKKHNNQFNYLMENFQYFLNTPCEQVDRGLYNHAKVRYKSFINNKLSTSEEISILSELYEKCVLKLKLRGS